MEIHDVHGTPIGFHEEAMKVKDFLRHEDRHVTENALKKAKEAGKHHLEVDGEKFTLVHDKGQDTYHVRATRT